MPSLSLSGGEGLMRKQPAQIVTNKRSPVVHVSTEVPRPLGEAFEDIARANGITKAELLRRLRWVAKLCRSVCVSRAS
jgi:hypothetical protein